MFSIKDNERKQKISAILKEIHNKIPSTYIDTSVISNFEIRSSCLDGKKVNRLIIYLRSSGCRWMINDKHGGCTMCGHIAGSTLGKNISVTEYKKQFENIFAQFDFSKIPVVCVYNEGSLFNEDEMPSGAREYIFHSLNEVPEIKHVIFESRPEYLSLEMLYTLRNIIPDKRIEIGIGLESSNEYVRQICLNKGFHANDFLKAVDLLKTSGIHSLAYVLLKPPFLSEAVAIEDSVNTIKWAFQHGVNVISLEPVSVQKFTLIHLLHGMKQYRPPWIWSVLKVVSQVGQLGHIRIGGTEFYPSPFISAHNCQFCDEACIGAIEKYNSSNDISVINSTLTMDCSNCKDEWLKQMAENNSIKESIDAFISTFDIDGLFEVLMNDF